MTEQTRRLVPLFGFVVASGCLLVFAMAKRPQPLNDIRAQLADVEPRDVRYIEFENADGSHAFSNDSATIASCVNAIKNATGRGIDKAASKIPMYFYLTPGQGGVERRRPIWVSSRDNATVELGSGMSECIEKFDHTSKSDPPSGP